MASRNDALGADSIAKYIKQSLPKNSEQPCLRNAYSAIAIFAHACMLAVGFRLVGLGEDHKIEAHSEPDQPQALPSEWDRSDSYAFRYKHSQSSMEYMIKVTRLGSKAIILGMGLDDDKTAQFEVKAQDYTSEGSLKDVKMADTGTDSIRNAFMSSGRMTDLSSLFKSQIIQKLIPGLRKEGYEESAAATAGGDGPARNQDPRRDEGQAAPRHDPLRDGPQQPEPARPYPFDDPLAAGPTRNPRSVPDFRPPGFEDEFELQRPGMRGGLGGYEPFGRIGEQDLYPQGLGPNDPLRIGGQGGGFRGGGGMHPTFDDPLFQGQGGQGAYNPRAPPGARYDPIGPGDGPPNLRGGSRFPGGGGFGGGAPHNPFGGFGSGDFI